MVFNEAIRLGLILSTISDTILSRFCLIKELFLIFYSIWHKKISSALKWTIEKEIGYEGNIVDGIL
jgi:hypothetical protein